jgi:hypothetical protein
MKASELFEKKLAIPDWAMEEQADFRAFVKEFGFQLNTRLPVFQLPDQWMLGGEIKDKDTNDLLSPEHRFKAFKKGLAAYLVKKAKNWPRYVKIAHSGTLAPYYINPDNPRNAEDDINYVVSAKTNYHGELLKPIRFSVTWSISEPK